MSIKYHDAIVGVTLGGSETSGVIEEWNFTSATPLIGLKRATALTQSNVTFNSNGAIFNADNDYIRFGSLPIANHIIEVDIAYMSLPLSSNHQRFIMADDDEGLIYRYTSHQWEFYGTNGWATSSGEGDPNFFSGATVRCEIDKNNYWHIYKNGVLWYEPNIASPLRDFQIGSNDTKSIQNATITALRFL